MGKLRILLADDEPLALEKLSAFLEGERDVDIVGCCRNGRDAVAIIEQERPDLVFLDVQMPELTGFEVIEVVGPDAMPLVIFCTAYDRYALRAFEVRALDYLLKPFDHRRLKEALSRAREKLAQPDRGALTEELTALLDQLDLRRGGTDRMVIKSRGRVFFVKPEDIDWVEAAGNYVNLHVDSETHLLRETMASMEKKLKEHNFLRIHRSTIVNVERIKQLDAVPSGEYIVTLLDGKRLTLSRGYRNKLDRLLGDSL